MFHLTFANLTVGFYFFYPACYPTCNVLLTSPEGVVRLIKHLHYLNGILIRENKY